MGSDPNYPGRRNPYHVSNTAGSGAINGGRNIAAKKISTPYWLCDGSRSVANHASPAATAVTTTQLSNNAPSRRDMKRINDTDSGRRKKPGHLRPSVPVTNVDAAKAANSAKLACSPVSDSAQPVACSNAKTISKNRAIPNRIRRPEARHHRPIEKCIPIAPPAATGQYSTNVAVRRRDPLTDSGTDTTWVGDDVLVHVELVLLRPQVGSGPDCGCTVSGSTINGVSVSYGTEAMQMMLKSSITIRTDS